MNSLRLTSRLPIAGLLGSGLVALGWLLLVFGGAKTGQIPLTGATDAGVVEFYRDSGGRLTLAEVEQLPAARWLPWAGREYLTSDQADAVWLRVTLHNRTGGPQHGVLENDDYFADRVDAWITGERGREHLLAGEAVPAGEKALVGREVAVPVTVPAGGTQVVYLRAESYFGPDVRLVWWPEARAFHLAQSRGALAEGIYFGGWLALLGYTTLLWLRLRLRDIGWYVLYLGAGGVFMLLARAQLPVLGWALGSPGLETALTVVEALSGFFLIRFARAFLELPAHFPRMDLWMRRWSVVLLALAAGAFTTSWWEMPRWMQLATMAVGCTHLGLLAVGFAAWRAGVRQARFFMLSFGCLFAGSLPLVVVWFTGSLLREVAVRGLMIGSALEMLLLSLAVADRFVRTQRQLVQETEQRRAIEEAYADELETEVRERTRELHEANADKDRMLTVIGHDLRSPLTGLMKSADRVPGEFARDTALTGRTLLLMIEDLVLWARMRAGTRDVAAHPAHELLQPAMALHRALAEGGGTTLALDVPATLRVETDLVLAQTLVRNLLANALKFARAGIVLGARDDGRGGVRFWIYNDGPPLPAEIAARLASDQDEPVTAIGGLGLRLCREICAALGVKLEARVPAEGGTEFAFTLPAAGGEEEKT